MTSPGRSIKIMTSPISEGSLSYGRNNWGHNNSLLSNRISSNQTADDDTLPLSSSGHRATVVVWLTNRSAWNSVSKRSPNH